MTGKFVVKTWWLLTLSLVAATAIGSLMTAYFALFSLVDTRWAGGATQAGVSALLAGRHICCADTGRISWGSRSG